MRPEGVQKGHGVEGEGKGHEREGVKKALSWGFVFKNHKFTKFTIHKIHKIDYVELKFHKNHISPFHHFKKESSS